VVRRVKTFLYEHVAIPSVFWHCWLGDREGVWPGKNPAPATLEILWTMCGVLGLTGSNHWKRPVKQQHEYFIPGWNSKKKFILWKSHCGEFTVTFFWILQCMFWYAYCCRNQTVLTSPRYWEFILCIWANLRNGLEIESCTEMTVTRVDCAGIPRGMKADVAVPPPPCRW